MELERRVSHEVSDEVLQRCPRPRPRPAAQTRELSHGMLYLAQTQAVDWLLPRSICSLSVHALLRSLVFNKRRLTFNSSLNSLMYVLERMFLL